MTDGSVLDVPVTFAIKATAKGGASQFKEVSAKIVVCGSETLSRADDITFEQTIDLDSFAFPTDVDLLSMF